ncbi:precorrin-4 C(11)-methyltransferase [Thermosynechococcus sp. GLH187]|uniref:precorrin-4 C(11)-methyltransferase n=1 Tax=unclassified Thermosynechococcus TaxID=2622553 RepID=UPI0019804D3B|nr:MULTISPECIES: precorrin-4 C(11)-methyltransferase [unclassified Thermosynechococcus]MDR5638085.1 precorrin-4 C(11)-methyltransferase [Thermosynechococcus sp. PP42]MDR7921288.1 precorrin-4 C(11)-methyltransferase [Thermosynechococcus sp. HY213]QSF49992.1 precorrin-4 C(11)-methyltransferase [Thermosynechococcus sp. TA-1]WKT82041.1 precorrin-4 C(11)-methyltransferase [Thermosynechococcus sp. PP45]WNC25655.1 precorrin-4 C(11)-methyltransferase [Thermosynechococcus sp. PP551]
MLKRQTSAGVYFVGAGPGDPELLTLKGQRLIQEADVIFYADSLVPTGILQFAPPSATCIPTAAMTLEEMIPLMVEAVQAGKKVVRLQSGDPSLYSAIHEQIARLTEAGITVEVVPGISAYQLAAARLNAELTLPELVQTIILTRASGRTRVPPTEELASLAAHKASLCLYLSANCVHRAQRDLLQHYPPETPVAVGYRLGWPDEQLWLVPLAEMAAFSQQQRLTRTTLYLISPALAVQHQGHGSLRSCLYSPEHHHLFRPH